MTLSFTEWCIVLTASVVEDNTALSQASVKAKELGVPVVVLFVLSPGDYKIHDRSPRRIDFILRNLRNVAVRIALSSYHLT